MAKRVDYTFFISSDPSSDFIYSEPSSGTTSHGSDSDSDQKVGNVTGILYEALEVTSPGIYLSTHV